MIHPSRQIIFKGIQRALHFFLICLGIYFIYIGDVVNRYKAQKTNLAEYFEPIRELPTVFAWIEFSGPSTGLRIGLDFNITWTWDLEWYEYQLELGEILLNNGLKIKLEEKTRMHSSQPQMYKIIPLNFPEGMPEDYTG